MIGLQTQPVGNRSRSIIAICGFKLFLGPLPFLHCVRRGVTPQDCSSARCKPSVGTGASANPMAVFLHVPYAAGEQAALLMTIDDDISFLWNAGNKVPLDVQAKLADLGVADIGV